MQTVGGRDIDGRSFGPYRIIGHLASGGVSVVYRAAHAETGQHVALKVVRRVDEHALDSMRREAHGLSRLRHPGVVRILGHGSAEGLPWYAMELLEGPTLRDQIARGAAPLARTLTIVRRLARTLAFLHGEGVVHRDLKPTNIIVQAGDRPVIVDFGIARRFAGAEGRETLEVDAGVHGTLEYVAPEQLRGLDPDARTDLYAVGCILFEAVCGRPPFTPTAGTTIARQHVSVIPPLASSFAAVPAELDRLIADLLEKDPADRPGHADEICRVLDALGADATDDLAAPMPRTYLYQAPFVGHADLRAALLTEVDRARAGEGRVVLLSAPSGAGKTRLAMEVARDARRAGLRVVTGECLPAGADRTGQSGAGGGALQGFRSVLERVGDLCRATGPAATQTVFGANLRVLEAFETTFASLPGRVDEPPLPALSPEDEADRTQRAMADVLVAWTRGAPTLLAIDDIQWADDLTLGTLRLLGCAAPSEMSLVVLLTCRTEGPWSAVDDLRDAPDVVSMPLLPLDARDVGRIAAGMTSLRALPAALTDALAAHSGGNPLFAAEILKAAVREGILVRREGRWELGASGGDLASVTDPTGFDRLRRVGGVEALIAQRLEGLDPSALAFAQAGAVIGREWSEDLAARVAGLGDTDSLAAAETLLLRQVLVETERSALRFVHDRLRETAYAMLSEQERRRLHLRAADALEAEGRADPADAGTLRSLALHYGRAAVPAKAFRYALGAGQRALASGAFHEATKDLEVALAIANAPSNGIALSRLAHGSLCRSLADALYASGDLAGMGARATEGISALGVVGVPRDDRGWVLASLANAARLAVLGWRHDAARTGERRARVAATGMLLARLSEHYLYSDRPVSWLAANLAASRCAEEARDSSTIAWVGGNLGVAISPKPFPRLGRRFVDGARSHAGRVSSVDVRLRQAQVEAYYWHLQAAWARACDIVDGALDLALRVGASFRREQLMTVSIIVRLERGAPQRAVADARLLLASSRARGGGLSESLGELLLGLALVRAGRYADGLPHLESGARRLDAPHLVVQRANCHAGAAICRLDEGDLEGAVREVDIVDRLVPKLHPSNKVARAMMLFAPWVRLAALDDARRRREGAAVAMRRAAAAVALSRRHAQHVPSHAPTSLRHESEHQRVQGHLDRARATSRRALALARRLDMPLDEAWCHLDLARLSADDRSSHLSEAARLFERNGSELLASKVRELADGPTNGGHPP